MLSAAFFDRGGNSKGEKTTGPLIIACSPFSFSGLIFISILSEANAKDHFNF
jgi:hypothetical protein